MTALVTQKHRSTPARNSLRSMGLLLPMTWNQRVTLYYRTYSHFLHILAGDTAMLNFGQEQLCDETVAKFPPYGRWLDVGCGIGGPACYFGSRRPDVGITGINITDHQLVQAASRAATLGLESRVMFQHGDACNMPFDGTAHFDALYAIESAFHYPDKGAFVREAFRVLKAGGSFACADLVSREGRPIAWRDRFVNKVFFGWFGAFKTLGPSEWASLLESAGFEEVEIVDVTDSIFRPGLAGALERIEQERDELLRHYTPFSIAVVRWCYRWLLTDLERRPIQYVVMRARKPGA
ncbi:MAG: methyltransferase domain-containing protein [Deltaproteobacteria bacterium]|nr:methyltransferase domain-containing protein [Deltaproteobacteria bacterium]